MCVRYVSVRYEKEGSVVKSALGTISASPSSPRRTGISVPIGLSVTTRETPAGITLTSETPGPRQHDNCCAAALVAPQLSTRQGTPCFDTPAVQRNYDYVGLHCAPSPPVVPGNGLEIRPLHRTMVSTPSTRSVGEGITRPRQLPSPHTTTLEPALLI
jgi:hypothetical protein